MELTGDHLDVAFAAWAAARDRHGVCIKPGRCPEAHKLAEEGWLKRRFVTESGELSWWWTGAAELALKLAAITDGSDRAN